MRLCITFGCEVAARDTFRSINGIATSGHSFSNLSSIDGMQLLELESRARLTLRNSRH